MGMMKGIPSLLRMSWELRTTSLHLEHQHLPQGCSWITGLEGDRYGDEAYVLETVNE